jgi:hypothetical protein
MSYYFRRRQMQAAVVQKDGLNRALNAAAEFASRARSMWDESKVTRGKTTPESNAGSFAPSGASGERDPATGRKWTPEAADMLAETQQTLYRRLHRGELKTREAAESYAQAKMRKWMGPGYERRVSVMVDRIWAEFTKNGPHRYFGPSHLVEGWAVKGDLVI